MIRFLFMESMLMGAYFRQKNEKYQNCNSGIKNGIIAFVLFIIYFASKLIFSKGLFTEIQIANQFVLLGLLFYIFKTFASVDSKLERIPQVLKKIIQFISTITLEIYLVQYPIIPIFAKLPFPINWLIITSTILISAYALHIITKYVINLFERKKKSENIDNRGCSI